MKCTAHTRLSSSARDKVGEEEGVGGGDGNGAGGEGGVQNIS